MFVTNWISTTRIQKISEITNFFRHYFLSRTEVLIQNNHSLNEKEKENISSSLSVGLNSSLYWDCLEKQIKDN